MSDVRMKRSNYLAVRRVLTLLGGYLANMPNDLHGFDGGMMTTTELLEHVNAARYLMPLRKRKVKP